MEQTKTHRTKSKAAKTMNLLSAIESVAVSAKDSQLCDQFFVDRKAELKFPADSYGITPLQATLFCVCMERGPHRIDFDDDALLKDILRPDTTDELVLAGCRVRGSHQHQPRRRLLRRHPCHRQL